MTPAPPGPELPTVRLLHHLARKGGTVLSRCLAATPGVTLLSEIHPRGPEVVLQVDPLFQAQYWLKLLSDAEVRALREAEADVATCVARLATRATERGEALVVRDWSHLDFMARPFLEATADRLSLAEALAGSCRFVQTATVRHPPAQWLSWQRFVPDSGLSLADFMAGNRRFAEVAAALGFLRYEDFASNPDAVLAELCWRLELEFDPGYAYWWFFCRAVSGDIGSLDRYRIEPVAPPRVSPALHASLEANPDYVQTLDLLGYERDWLDLAA